MNVIGEVIQEFEVRIPGLGYPIRGKVVALNRVIGPGVELPSHASYVSHYYHDENGSPVKFAVPLHGLNSHEDELREYLRNFKNSNVTANPDY